MAFVTKLAATAVLVACALSVLPPSTARAAIYWGNNCRNFSGSLGDTIGRASLDGAVVDQNFITGVQNPCFPTLTSQHIYWGSAGPATRGIGRANIDGTGLNNSFISSFIATSPDGLATDGSYLYFACGVSSLCGAIGRVNLDSTGAVTDFVITGGATTPCGVAVDDAHIWWGSPATNSIGRADLNGANANNLFITGTTAACGVVSDGTNVVWTNTGGSTIGIANVDGTGVDQSFITDAVSPCGIDFDDNYLYWANSGDGTIGRASLNGVDPAFISGAEKPCGVAVDSLAVPVPPASVTQTSPPASSPSSPPASSSAPTAVTAPLPASLKVSGLRGRVRGTLLRLALRCNGLDTQVCTGRATATTRIRTAARSARSQKIIVGQTAFSIPGTQGRAISLRLNAAGRRLLTRFRRLPVVVAVTSSGLAGKIVTVASRNVTFTARSR